MSVEMTAELVYRDPKAALEWLARAFGFETELLVTGSNDAFVIARAGRGGGAFMLLPENERLKSPLTVGGANTQIVRTRLGENIDAHFERAKAAGAKVLTEPRQEFYGDRVYVVADPEGHQWGFAQTVAAASPPPKDWNVSVVRPR